MSEGSGHFTPTRCSEPVIGNALLAMEAMWADAKPILRRLARTMTDDVDLQKDMLQEALILLWELDPTRFDPRKPGARRYLTKMMINQMRIVVRRELSRPRMERL